MFVYNEFRLQYIIFEYLVLMGRESDFIDICIDVSGVDISYVSFSSPQEDQFILMPISMKTISTMNR